MITLYDVLNGPFFLIMSSVICVALILDIIERNKYDDWF